MNWLEIRDDEGSFKTFKPEDVRRVSIHDTPDFLRKGEAIKSYVNLLFADGGNYAMTFKDRARAESVYNAVRESIGLSSADHPQGVTK